MCLHDPGPVTSLGIHWVMIRFGVLRRQDLQISTTHPVSSLNLFTPYPILSPTDLRYPVHGAGHTRMEQPAWVQPSKRAGYAMLIVSSVLVCSAGTKDRLPHYLIDLG